MRNGTMLGAICGLLACGVLISGASLMKAPPGAPGPEARPGAPQGGATLQEDARDPIGSDGADRRLSVPSDPDVGASFGASSIGRIPADPSPADMAFEPVDPPGSAPVDMTDTPARARATVALSDASEFNRPPEDRVIAPPTEATAPNPASAADAPAVARPSSEMPRAETRSGAAPRVGSVSGFADDPAAGQAPNVPGRAVEAVPKTAARPSVSMPDTEPAASVNDAPQGTDAPAGENVQEIGAPATVTLVPK